ncbi:MAG: hypothetical protein ACRCT8_01875 [Lacipirellulaceae bacterium]
MSFEFGGAVDPLSGVALPFGDNARRFLFLAALWSRLTRSEIAVAPLAWAVVLTLTLAPCAATAFLVPNGDFEADNGETPLAPTLRFTGGPTSYALDDDSDGVGSQGVQITGNFGDWRSSAVQVVPGTSIQWLLDYEFLAGAAAIPKQQCYGRSRSVRDESLPSPPFEGARSARQASCCVRVPTSPGSAGTQLSSHSLDDRGSCAVAASAA